MARDKQTDPTVPVYGGMDGLLAIRKLEDDLSERLLQMYGARIDGYKVEQAEVYTSVTMKVGFPLTANVPNAEYWAWMIVKAIHPTAVKPRFTCIPDGEGLVVYAQWPIWKNLNYRESTRKGGNFF